MPTSDAATPFTPSASTAPTAQTTSTASTGPTLLARLAAETLGTFLLVFGVVATALFSAHFPFGAGANDFGVGFIGVALALGLSVMLGAYAFGPISGGHFNPAVTLGLSAAGRFAWKDAAPYIGAQFVGAFLGSTLVYVLSLGAPGSFRRTAVDGGFVSNGFGDQSPGGFGLGAAILIEVVITAVFLFVILGVTHARAQAGFAPLAIGLTLTLLLLISIPVDNASINPARSMATAVYAGGPWLGQVWVFIVFPIVGALLAGVSHRFLFETREPSAAGLPLQVR
jgi:aquaporin Z